MPGPRDAAERYFAAVNGADLALMGSLFAVDAVLRHPSGTFIGRQDVVAFYRDVVFAFGTSITATASVEEGTLCAVTFEGRSPMGSDADVVHACDIFRVDTDGAITELDIYYR